MVKVDQTQKAEVDFILKKIIFNITVSTVIIKQAGHKMIELQTN
jgi:hypothetical protein